MPSHRLSVVERKLNQRSHVAEQDGQPELAWPGERVNGGQLESGIQVCGVGTEDWLLYTMLPDSVLSVRDLAQPVTNSQPFVNAEETQLALAILKRAKWNRWAG